MKITHRYEYKIISQRFVNDKNFPSMLRAIPTYHAQISHFVINRDLVFGNECKFTIAQSGEHGYRVHCFLIWKKNNPKCKGLERRNIVMTGNGKNGVIAYTYH